MAIAYDTVTDGGYGASGGKTFSHTCSGSNRILFVSTFGAVGSDTVTGVTYNGVAMTLVKTLLTPTDGRYLGAWVLMNPASGANNVVISVSSGDTYGMAVSYTGTAQTGQPDSFGFNSNTFTSSLTTSTNVVASNCWNVYLNRAAYFPPPVAGTGATLRSANATYGQGIFDSNGTVGTGSQSMTCTCSSPGPFSGVLISFAPSASGPANMKTWDGLATASVKTMGGLAIGSVKTWNGLA